MSRRIRLVRKPQVPAAKLCHWQRLPGPVVNGEHTSTPVWICQYPYPTMRSARPDDCEGCPIHQLMERPAV